MGASLLKTKRKAGGRIGKQADVLGRRGPRRARGGLFKEAGALWSPEGPRGTREKVTGQDVSGQKTQNDVMEGNSGIHCIAEHSRASQGFSQQAVCKAIVCGSVSLPPPPPRHN